MLSHTTGVFRTPVRALALLCGLVLVSVVPAASQDRRARIVGTVTDDSGMPVRMAEVHALVEGRPVARSVTDGEGRYRIEVDAPRVTLRVAASLSHEGTEERSVDLVPGAVVEVDLVVTPRVLGVEGFVVTADGLPRAQDLGSVGGFIGVVRPEEIRRRVTFTPTDALRYEPGVDMADTGLSSRITTIRAFNNIFTGSVRYLTDFRPANLPSLRANFMHFSPTATADVHRMELILGPSSVIYGPNSASGVLNVLTRSPLAELPEASVAFSGGSRSVFQSEARFSQTLGERFGFKVSTRWFQGDEYPFVDPVEERARGLIETDPARFAAGLRDVGVPDEEIPLRLERVGVRDLAIRRWSVDGRVDWSPSSGDTLIVQAGRSSSTGIENTPLGAAQAGDWLSDYAQLRLHSGAFFAQAFMNGSDAGESYLLRDGGPLFDRSRVVGLQARHGIAFFDGAEEITYGADWTRTTPRTGGTIHGQFEDEDEITEWGVFAQSRTRVADGVHLLGNLRFDESSVVDEPVLSPRVGVVWEPAAGHTLSASWSRGFSTPTPTNYFLDISGGTAPGDLGALGYRTRARGTGRAGIRFSDGAGGYQGMRSPCTPAAAGGPSALVPATSTNVWRCVVGVMAAQGAIDPQTAAFLAGLDPAGSVSLNALDPVTLASAPLAPGAVDDVAPLRENTTTTIEAGYRGRVGDRMSLQTAVWHTTRHDMASPLTLVTPLLTLDGTELAAFLVDRGLPTAQAQALAAGAAGIPGGVLSSSDIEGQGAELVQTYRNFGEIRYWGVDLAAQIQLSRSLTLHAKGSWVSDDDFQVGERRIPLNAPALKGSLSLAFDRLALPMSGEVGVRYLSEFPVESGDYVGKACLGEAFAATDDCVSEATLVDASVGWEGVLGSDASLRLAVRDLLDSGYQAFLGVPEQGRQVVLRIEYRLW